MWTEQVLDAMLTEPSQALVEDIQKIAGNILVLGAGGKMGPSLCVLIRNACEKAGIKKEIIAASRFSDPIATAYLKEKGITLVFADLLDEEQVKALPDADNVIFMAGRKFGTNGQEAATWAMNAVVPANAARRFANARTVVFSSGNIYPMVPLASGGATEETPTSPVGEYAMSCLARERVFEYYSRERGVPILLYRLNYAVDLRYGVLHDIARSIMEGTPVPLATGVVNLIWQHDANEIAVRSLLHTGTPPTILNVTGPETLSVRAIAEELGHHLGKKPVFAGEESPMAFINNAAKATELFGYPTVSARTMIRWQAEWLLQNGRSLGKPTHFEERKGSF